MDNETLEKLKEKYTVPDEKLEEIGDLIISKLTNGKTPVENPVAIIVGGQPGAGKSGLIDKTVAEMDNSVIFDLDDFRYFHPDIKEILKNYPNDLATFTIKFVNDVFKKFVFFKVIKMKYNIISQKTLRDDEIIADTLVDLDKMGYTVVVRALAVHELESKLSALERSLAVKRTVGFCRWTPIKTQDYAYNGLPLTTKHMFDSPYCDAVQIYTRNEVPVNSNLVYSKIKPSSEAKVQKSLKENPNLFLSNFGLDFYEDEVDAVLKNREKNALTCMGDIMTRIVLIRQKMDDEGKKYLEDLETLAAETFLKQNDTAEFMNNNIKLELAKEVMARKIADACGDNFNSEDENVKTLLKEEEEMNKFNTFVIDKIINKYGSEIKGEK